MTDKQIIIDVCPYQGECSVSGCKRNDDGCFVRQLFEERYRAENQIVELNKTIKAKEEELEAYKMEAEEGKEINAELKAENKNLKDHLELGTEMYGYKSEQLNQLKQAIEKIKEILLFNIEELEECLYNDIDKQILKICDEVNDDNA